MARRKIEDRDVRRLTRSGSTSLSVTLPVEEVRKLGWKEKQKVKVERVRGGFMIRDARS